MNALFASQKLLQAFADANACNLIPNNKPCKLLTFQNKKVIVIGSCSSGANGVHWVNAYECVPMDNYEGVKMSYSEHWYGVQNNKLERGYSGVIIKSDSKQWVIIGDSFTIKPYLVNDDIQLTFF